MSLEKGLDGNKFLNRIEEIFDKAEKRAVKKADEVGTNVGKAFSDSMANGLDAGKLMVEWQKFVRSINNNKTQIKPAKIQTILETAETLKDTERFGKTIRDQLSGIKATFGDVEVSGLDNVIEKFKTSANELSSIDWGFGKLHDNRKLMQEQVDLGEKLVKSAEQQAKATEKVAKAQKQAIRELVNEIEKEKKASSEFYNLYTEKSKSIKAERFRDRVKGIQVGGGDRTDIKGILSDLDAVNEIIAQVDNSCRAAVNEVENLESKIESFIRGDLTGKRSLQNAIKEAWGNGEKSKAAKLFEQYQVRFPDGKFNPDKLFGDDWTNNFYKNLDDADQVLAELREKRLQFVDEMALMSASIPVRSIRSDLNRQHRRALILNGDAKNREEAERIIQQSKATEDLTKAVEATTVAIDKQVATAVQEIPKVIKNYQDLKTVLQECERLAGQQIKYSKPDIIDLVESLRYRGSVSGYYPDDPRRIDAITEAWNAYKKLEGTVESTNKDLLVAKDRITALAVDYARSHKKLSALNNKELESFTKNKYDEYATAKSHYKFDLDNERKHNEQLFNQMNRLRGTVLNDVSQDIRQQILGYFNQVMLKGGKSVDVLTPMSQLMGLDDLGQFKKNIEPMVQGFMEIDPAKIKFTELCDAIQNTGMTAEEAIKQFNEFKSGIDTTTVAIEEQVDGMGKLTQLIDELTFKYGKNSFDNIFGSTIADFGTLNASNAIGLYDALIERENKHIIQLQREARQREVNRRHIEEFVGYFKENQEKITAIPNGLQQYGILVAEISRRALNAKDAIAQLNNEIEKSKAPTVVGISQPTTPKSITVDTKPAVVGITQPTTPKGITVDPLAEYKSSFSDQEMKSILKGIDINAIAKTFNIIGEERQVLSEELKTLASMTAEMTTGKFDSNLYDKQYQKVEQMIISNGKNAIQNEKKFEKFLNYIGDSVIKYTDTDAKELTPDEWQPILKRFGVAKGKRPALISQDIGRAVDSFYDEMIDTVGEVGYLKREITNSHQRFKAVVQTLELAYDEKSTHRKNEYKSLDQSDRQEIGGEIGLFLGKAYDNAAKMAEETLKVEQKITKEKEGQIGLIENTAKKTKEQAKAEKEAAKAAAELAKRKEKVNNLLGVGLAEEVSIDEFVRQGVNKSIEQLRNSDNSGKNVINFKGVFNGEDLLDQVNDAVHKITKQTNFEIDKFNIGKSDASFKLINQETGFAIEQTYILKDATEELGSATIEVTNRISGSMLTARKNLMGLISEYNKIDLEKQKASLNGQDVSIYNKEQEIILTRIVNLLDLVELSEKEQIELNKIDNQLIQQKAKLIETAAQKEKQAQEEISKITNNVSQQINQWKSSGSFNNVFSKDLQNEIKNLQSSLSSLDENSDLPKIKKQWDDVAAKAKEAIKANQEYANSFYKNEFQNNYKYNNGKTVQDQTTFDSMRDFYNKQEQDAQNFNNNIKRIYSDLISTLQQINTLDTKINDLSLKDGGSGLYSASIQSLQTQKSGLVANMRSITDEINRTVNASANENGIAKFFDVAKQKAVLTSAEIEKFDQLLLQADRTGFEFASKVTGKIQPVIEKLQALNKAVSDGAITNPDMIRGIDVISTTLSSKFNKFKEFGDAASAMDAMNYSDSISQNVAALDKLIQKESQYFANKQKYADGMKFDNLNVLSTDVKNTTSVMDKTKSDLSALAQEFAKGKAVITGFKQSADGISTLNFSVLDTATSSMRQFSMEMGMASKQAYLTETSISQSTKTIQNAEQQVGKMQSLLNTVSASGFKISGDGAHTSVSRLVNLMHELNTAAQKGDVTTIDELMKKSKMATSEVQKLYNESIKLQNSMDDGTARRIGDYNVGSAVTDFDQLSAAVRRHASDVEGASLKVGKFDEKHNKLNYTLTHGNGNVEHYTASINSLGKTINTQSQGVTKLQSGWKQLGGIISKSAKQMTMAIMGYNVFYQVIAKVRQGVTYIKEIDMAMTELKKVTDETSKSYETFVKNAAANGSKIGATVSDYVNATADFARLGYEMNEAGKMAEAAIVYKNVADGLDTIEASTESITSTMKAFGIESSGTMGIIDSFNEVGNNFAITSAGIGEALKRSASALDAGGNTLEESIGLITGANTVVQNPETVGTALKTLSLRIRGVKTELEEAGLETENMAETTSQLQAKLLALTHGKVDIMIDENNFKSTYQILEDMSKVWKEMTDVEQAAALELIGGKRQANILASLISNFEIAQNATETAANSAGSALKENEVYLDSIDGKTQLLTNSMQNLWNNAISSEGVKMFLDIANAIVKVTDKVGLLNVAISGLFGYLSASGKNNFLKFFTFNTKDPMRAVESNWLWNGKGGLFEGLRVAFSQIQPNKDGAGKIFDTTGIKKYISAIQSASAAESGFSKIKAISKAMTDASATSDIKKAATTKAVGVASTVASVGVSVLNAALTMGLGLLVGAAITGVMTLIDNAVHRAENLKQEVQELTDAYEEAKKSYSDNLDKLTTSSDTGLYSTLLDEFNALTQGVSKNGDNISLTADQYERYKEICETICEVNPNLIAGYDSATEAIGNKASALEDLIAAQQEAARREAAEYTSDENIKKYAEDAMNDYEEAQKEIESTKLKLQNKFKHELGEEVYDSFNISTQADGGKELIKRYLENAGMSPEDINSEIEKYTNDITGEVDFGTWLSENIDYISEHISGYSNELQSAAAEYRNAASDVATAQEGVINELLEIPVGLEEYKNLKSSEKSFITEWIKNSDMFKIDENTTAETVLGMKKTIENIVQDITEGDYVTTVNNQQFTATDILESIFNFDTTGVDWGKYQERMNEYVDYLWDAIGGVSNEFGFKDKDALKLSLGIDFQLEDETKMIKRYVELKDVTADEAQDYFDSLPTTEVQRLLQVDWNVITNEDELDKILEPKVSTSTPVQTYSTIAAEVTKYTETLSQSKEVVSDNTVVTQDFYDSLVDLAGSEEKVAECFDAANPLMVKNAEALNEVVNEAERNVSANVKLARTQARLQYNELYKELKKVTKGQEVTDLATLNYIDSLYEQMGLLEKTISQYSMLEAELLGATNAYTEFAAAQEKDESTDYIGKAEGMVLALGQAFNDATLGSETAQAAIKGLVPESVYKDLDTVDEKMQAIYDYFKDGDISDWFALEYDDEGAIQSAEMTVGTMKNFIEDGLARGVFTGKDWKHFELSEDVNSLEEFAEQMKTTEAVAFAFFETLEDHDIEWLNGDYSTLFDELVVDGRKLDSIKNQIETEFDQSPIDLTARVKVSKEKMHDAGYEKFDGDYATFYTSTFDSAEFGLTNKNGESFAINLTPILPDGTVIGGEKEGLVDWVNDQLDSGKKIEELDVFIGSYDSGKGIKESLKQAEESADRLHELSEAYTEAYGSFNLENDIQKNISELADLEYQLATGEITAKEYAKRLEELSGAQSNNAQRARDNAVAWSDATEDVTSAKEKVENLTDELNRMKSNGATEVEIKATTDELQEASKELSYALQKKYDLEEPTELTIKIALEDIEAEIAEWEKKPIIKEIRPDIKQDAETGEYTIDAQVVADFSDTEKASIEHYLGLLNDQYTITVLGDADQEDSTAELDKVKNAAELAKQAIENIPSPKVDTQAAQKSVQDLIDKISKIKSKTAFITTVYSSIGTPPKASGEHEVNGTANLLGTAHVTGTAHKTGDWGLPKAEHDSLVGELGPEIVVDPHSGRYYTVGDRGAEMVDLPKDAIIFNHKQTEDLLRNGHITSRGKAYAEGNAHLTIFDTGTSNKEWETSKNRDTSKNKDKKDSKDTFEEFFDWFEVKLEEINEQLDLTAAKLENAITIKGKNNLLNDMIAINKSELEYLDKGEKLYSKYADSILKEKKKNGNYIIPKKYWDEVQDGKVAIERFYGEVDEKTLEQIKNYREWAQKAADVKQQIQEIRREITELAKQKFDNISEKYDNVEGLQTNREQHYTDMADLRDDQGKVNSGKYYEAAKSEVIKQRNSNIKERDKLQAALDKAVRDGEIKVNSQEWYDAVDAIHEVDAAIDENNADIEDYQNRINEINFDNFEKKLYRVSRIAEETQNLIDVLANKPSVDVDDEGNVNFTDEGITQIGLYAQKIENAKKQSEMYAQQIDELNAMYARGEISYDEYLEKLDEYKDGQYEAIQAEQDAKDAIVELEKARVDEIKNGIDKQIEAYSELIDKKKEELDAEKDLYDFQRQTMDQAKNIADIQRQLAAISGDNSASANAQRKKLEAELAQAKQEQADSFYDRSVSNAQEALDNELELFTELREKEKENWDKWLENTDAVFAHAMETVTSSGETIKDTIKDVAEEWDLQINDNIKQPWKDASTALEDTASRLDNVIKKFDDAVASADALATKQIEKQQEQNDKIADGRQKAVKGLKVTATQGTQIYDKNGNVIRTVSKDDGETYTAGKTDSKTGRTQLINSKGEVVGYANSTSLKVDKTFKKGQTINAGGALIYDSATDKSGTYQDKKTYIVTKVDNKHGRVQVALPKNPNKPVGWFNMDSVIITKQASSSGSGKNSGSGKSSGSGKNTGGKTYPYGKASATTGNIQYGDTGKQVKAIQYALKQLGYSIGSSGIDGSFGPATREAVKKFQKNMKLNADGVVGKNTRKKFKAKGYAIGSKSINKDQLAWLDELGEELQIVPNAQGRLDYVKKGTGIIPADMTERLMNLAMNPQDMLDRSRPTVSISPEVHNTEINLNIQYGDMLKIENFKGDNPEDIAKIVAKQFEKHTKDLNSALRKYVR